jgi:hypothetical protein
MPLTVNNKTESKSIEDLIAQLDAPTNTPAAVNAVNNDDHNNKPVRNGRRTTSISDSAPILNKNILISKKYTKSHNKGRGLAKKGGGGGNYTWGAPGCELNADAVDTDDPNYDSEQDAGNYVMVCVENNENQSRTDSDSGTTANKRKQSNLVRKPQIECDEFDKTVKAVILEYFLNGDSVEVIDYLGCHDLSDQKIRIQLLAYIIQLAMEGKSTSKELTSRLLRDFHVELFKQDDFEGAFDALLKNLNELTLDNPNATDVRFFSHVEICVFRACHRPIRLSRTKNRFILVSYQSPKLPRVTHLNLFSYHSKKNASNTHYPRTNWNKWRASRTNLCLVLANHIQIHLFRY